MKNSVSILLHVKNYQNRQTVLGNNAIKSKIEIAYLKKCNNNEPKENVKD